MRVKLDENLPTSAIEPFRSAGHDVDTVGDENLSGAQDADVLGAATTDDRLIITLDRGFGDIRTYPPGSHAGVLVLRIDEQSPATIRSEVEQLVGSVDLDSLMGCVTVFRSGELRVRRPRQP